MTMRMRRRSTGAAIGILAAAGLVLVGAGPASAAYTDCSSGYACMWTGNSYPGSPNASFQSWIALNDSANKINSIVNNGNNSIAHFYDRADRTGANIALNNPARGGQWRDPNLSNGTDATTDPWNNRISSAQFE